MKKQFCKLLAMVMALCMACGAAALLSGCGNDSISVRTSPDDGPDELADTYKALYEETAMKLKQTENSLSKANAEKARLNQELSETTKDLEKAQEELTKLKEDYKSVNDRFTGLNLDYLEYKEKMQSYETYAENNTRFITPGISAGNCVGMNVQDVINRLEAAGFTNIRTVALGDLIFGFMHSDGDTEGISIGGLENFSAGSQFLSDSEVVVRYHTFAG
ncbi:MAG: hypothetical protein II795_02935 [Firmicutes bacterium]|nr:hypothetical protein [Bacillota bacterium]MBQ5959236.1 hypothetical protein [Bacillota bacterium]